MRDTGQASESNLKKAARVHTCSQKPTKTYEKKQETKRACKNDIPMSLHTYIKTLGCNDLTQTYILTGDYKRLCQNLNSEEKLILRGPKGCGKSLLLLKLLSDLIKKKEQVLYFRANTLKKLSLIKPYLQNSFLKKN